MKRTFKIIVVGLILAACHDKVQDQEPLTINTELTQISDFGQTTYARCIVVDGATIFVGTDNEIYRSINNGNSWTKLPPYTSVKDPKGLRSLDIKNKKLFGGGPYNGFIVSSDLGITWAKVPNSVPDSETVCSIASNSDFIFIGSYGSGLYRSGDNGESWENVFKTNPTGEPIWNLAVDGNNVLFFIPNKGVFLSSDNGSSWKDITSQVGSQGYGALYIKGSIILIGTDKLMKSNDLGMTWQEVNEDNGIEFPEVVSSITSFGSTIYEGGVGLAYSNDNGETWTKMPVKNKFVALFHLGANENYVFGLDQYNVYRISRNN